MLLFFNKPQAHKKYFKCLEQLIINDKRSNFYNIYSLQHL